VSLVLLALGCGAATSNTPPAVVISSPDDGDEFRAGEPFTATGKVDDNDGPNSLDVAWSIDPEPEVAGNPLRGEEDVSLFLASGISPEGSYELTLSATDVFGLTGSDTVEVEIAENKPPEVTIQQPANNDALDYGDPVIIEVKVNARDDAMSQVTLAWGGVAEGAADAPTQPPDDGLVIFYVEDVPKGAQSLTVTATDSGGGEDSATVKFRVR
jgi:hypothetical protein